MNIKVGMVYNIAHITVGISLSTTRAQNIKIHAIKSNIPTNTVII